jgi:hypothetical protein
MANSQTIALDEAIPAASDLLDGKIRGRLIVDVSAVKNV